MDLQKNHDLDHKGTSAVNTKQVPSLLGMENCSSRSACAVESRSCQEKLLEDMTQRK